MNELIQMVFDDYGYVKRWDCENTVFYMNAVSCKIKLHKEVNTLDM